MRTLPILAALVLLAPVARAAPIVVSHAGMLLDAQDQPVEALGRAVTFKLFAVDQPNSGETALWTGTYTVDIRQGTYAVGLGSGSSTLDTSDFPAGAERYLEVTVDSVVLLPRLRVGTTPNAGNTLLLAGRAIDEFALRSGATFTGQLTLATDPTSELHAATKNYVDTKAAAATAAASQAAAASLPLAGGMLTGALTLAGAPTASLHPATKQYADDAVALRLSLAGGTLTGPLALAADPTTPLGAATKQYVDGKTFAGGSIATSITVPSASFTTTTDAPFTVASNTKVANLNADTLDGLDSSAFAPSSIDTAVTNISSRQSFSLDCADFGAKGWASRTECLRDGRWHKLLVIVPGVAVSTADFDLTAQLRLEGAEFKLQVSGATMQGVFPIWHTYQANGNELWMYGVKPTGTPILTMGFYVTKTASNSGMYWIGQGVGVVGDNLNASFNSGSNGSAFGPIELTVFVRQ